MVWCHVPFAQLPLTAKSHITKLVSDYRLTLVYYDSLAMARGLKDNRLAFLSPAQRLCVSLSNSSGLMGCHLHSVPSEQG